MPTKKGKNVFILLISIFLLFFFSFSGSILGNTILVLETDVITDPLEDYATFLANNVEEEFLEQTLPEESIEEVEVPEEVMPQEVTPDEEEVGEEFLQEVTEKPEGEPQEPTEEIEIEEEEKSNEETEIEEMKQIEEEPIEPMTIDTFMENSLQFSNTVIIIGENAPTETLISALQLASTYGFKIVKDSDIEDISTVRAISLGSSSVNAVSAVALEQGAVAFASDEGTYFMYENVETNSVILVVAGENRRAVRDLLKY